MLKIWGRADAPNVQKVLWGCEELGLAYERIDVGGRFGGGDDPAYRAKNPNGLVPTLEDEAFVLWESHAILRYLAGAYPQPGLYPTGPRERAVIDQWLDWQAVHQAHAIRRLVMLLLKPGAAPAPGEVEAARKDAEPLFQILEARLAHSPYMAAAAFTLADIPIGIGVRRWRDLPIERPALPAIDAWLRRLGQRPAFLKVFPDAASIGRA